MISSTCLVVVFVPSFYVVMQRLEERRRGRSAPQAGPAVAQPEDAVRSSVS
jgi:HAE1 family hydrophobic/amphiphilic exporter-1